jgi:hypothetical protein
MPRLAVTLVAALALVACATYHNPLPENYSGPTARLRDSVTSYNGTKADYFFLYQYNGTSIRQTYDVSVENSRGNGFMLLPPEVIDRAVPAERGRFYLLGRTHYAAPIQELVHGVYMVKGEVNFTPKADASYIIRGTLGPSLAEIWIEDAATGQIASTKLSTSTPSAISPAHETDSTPNSAH